MSPNLFLKNEDNYGWNMEKNHLIRKISKLNR